MLLDDFFQIALPCLLVLFCNEGWALLSIASFPGEWLNVKMPEEGFMLVLLSSIGNIYTGTITKMPYSNQY